MRSRMCNYFFTLAMARKLEAFIIEPCAERECVIKSCTSDHPSRREMLYNVYLSQLTAPLRALIDQGVIIPYR